jgi:membrane protein YdbS with pleckstrin-like domain
MSLYSSTRRFEVSPNVNDILIAEFEYVAQTAFQANEDRARVTTLYLVTAGSLVAAILSSQVLDTVGSIIYFSFAALLTLLSIVSLLALLQLVRLRLAWFDSALAMNQIKDFYVRHTEGVNLQEAFRWSTETLPSKCRPWSVASLLAIQISLLGGATSGAAVLFMGLGLGHWWSGGAIIVGLVYFIIQITLYRRLLCT